MPPMPDFLIAALILSAVVVAILLGRREGQANPVGTGKLQSDVTALKASFGKMQTQLAAMRGDLDDAPTKADLEKLRGEIVEVRGGVDVVTERIIGVHELGEKTDQAVVRIEMMLMGGAVGALAAPRTPRKPR